MEPRYINGMRVYVYFNPVFRGATNGPTGTHDWVFVEHPALPKNEYVDADGPRYHLTDYGRGFWRAVTNNVHPDQVWAGRHVTFGGSYVGCLDSRWNRVLRDLGMSGSVLPAHDRCESMLRQGAS